MSTDKSSSTWATACTGAVGPATADGCQAGDDANCNGLPNEGCACVNGTTQTCGPANVGICRSGTATCTNQQFSACVGAVSAALRKCTSSLDSDCDGKPDNVIDTVCTCQVGVAQACQVHPNLDGHEPCRAGTQTCVAAADGASSSPRACTGSVGPGLRNCASSADNDCDGKADNVLDTICACAPGSTQACGTHPGLDGHGPCRAGTQTCVAAANGASSSLAACVGSVGPGVRSCTSTADNDCDGVADNTVDAFCTCAPGTTRACTTGLSGPCGAGTMTCTLGPNGSTSAFGPCVGTVSPAARDTCDLGDDSSCNGVPNEGCKHPSRRLARSTRSRRREAPSRPWRRCRGRLGTCASTPRTSTGPTAVREPSIEWA